MTPARIRDARDRWYAEAEAIDLNEAERLANMIANDHRLLSTHRGAMAWGNESSIIFGNDGSIIDGLGPPEGRTLRQIRAVQRMLRERGIDQTGFATSSSKTTWVIVAASNDVDLLRDVVREAFWAVIDRSTTSGANGRA